MLPLHPDQVAARRWLWLATGVLAVAGGFALLLVIARMPPFDALVTDPGFFRRCLVVHVELSIVCWFYAFLGALLMALPRSSFAAGLTPAGPALGGLGVLLLCGSAFAPGARPVMSNYVPVVDHPLALLGLALFGVGVLAAVLSRRLLPGGATSAGPAWPGAVTALPALRAAAVALLLAAVTLLATLPALPAGAAAEVHYEVLFWGAGHVLQLASTAAMLGGWLWAVQCSTGRPALSRRATGLLMALLVLPWLLAPLLPAAGAWSATYKTGFTRLMQWALAPVALIVLAACARTLWRHRTGWDGPRIGFCASAGLTVLGFVLGASIRDSNTVIPAHYHANIGAVTAIFMTVGFALLPALGLSLGEGRLARLVRWQPLWFGAGQAVFAIGFGLAGSQGMARKVYGQEQAARGALESLGLVIMGLGGFVAIAAGVLFLVAHARAAVRCATRGVPPHAAERASNA